MSKVKITVTATAEVESLGIETLLELMHSATDEVKGHAIIEVGFDDLEEFLDSAKLLSIDVKDSNEGRVWRMSSKS